MLEERHPISILASTGNEKLLKANHGQANISTNAYAFYKMFKCSAPTSVAPRFSMAEILLPADHKTCVVKEEYTMGHGPVPTPNQGWNFQDF